MSESLRRRGGRGLPVVFAGALGVGALAAAAGSARAAEPTQQELIDELRALRAKVEQLEAKQQQQQQQPGQQATQPSGKEVDATVDGVLRDADARSHLLQAQGFTAGYDKGFVIRSEDGNFVLRPGIQFQARYVADYREEDADNAIDGDATTESGFEIRRLKFALEGNVFGPDTKYKFQWATNRSSGNLVLDDAYVTHRLGFAPDLYVRVGQFKDAFSHEEITSSKRQLAVDRSLANEYLAGGQTDWVQGVALIWDDGAEGLPLRGEVGFTDGPNTDNTNFVDGGGTSAFGLADPDFGMYGRAEYLVFGDWKHYDDFSAMGNKQDTLVVGAGASYAQAGDNNVLFHSFDAQYEYYKLGLYAAYYGVFSDGAAGDDSAYDLGGVVQAAYMVTDKWEPFVRYSLVSLDTGASGSDDNYHELTAGVNYYVHGHAAKFTLDLTYLPNGVPSDQNQIGELDPDADDDQFVLRAQFQLLL